MPRGFSRLAAVVVAVVAAFVGWSGSAHAAPCGTTPGLQCTVVSVPLDRTGHVPGTIALHVEYLPAQGTPRGTVFLVAGGPGQGSAHTFDLGTPDNAQFYQGLFPGYTLVAYDDRGTGESGVIDCPPLQHAVGSDQEQTAAVACAVTIGSARTFYSTGEHAEDMDAVRAALGVEKIALYGVSYGTKLSLSYALAHPDHVERMVLDSVLPPELPDPFNADVLRGMPSKLAAFCSDGSCRAATPNFAADVIALANAYAAKPLVGRVLEPSGRMATQRVDGIELLSTVLDGDLYQGLAAELPAAMRAARLGNTRPLLRLVHFDQMTNAFPSVDLSAGLYAATVCSDGPFPWQPDAPLETRAAAFKAAVDALGPRAFGPFGKWAARFGNADFCLRWPTPAGGAPFGPGPLPDVPVLAVSGGIDMRTPTANAASVVARFPQGQLLVVPGVGHAAIGNDLSLCAFKAVRAWIVDGTAPSRCSRGKAIVPTLGPFPAATTPAHLGPLATYAIALKTVREAEAAWMMANDSPLGGIYAGKIMPTPRGFTLTRYAIAPGVELSGTFRLTNTDLPFGFDGTVRVGGRAAATGILGLTDNTLRGTLGGRLVG